MKSGVCLLMLFMTGCAHGGGSLCNLSPIRPALTDVLAPSTEAQILIVNETGAKECGWKP